MVRITCYFCILCLEDWGCTASITATILVHLHIMPISSIGFKYLNKINYCKKGLLYIFHLFHLFADFLLLIFSVFLIILSLYISAEREMSFHFRKL